MGLRAEAREAVIDRARAKSDRLFLAREVLGYDFTEITHAELFAQFPAFNEEQAWAEQFPKRDALILWPRGHYKTTAVVVIVIQAILINPNIRVILMQGSKENTRNLLSEIASHFTGQASASKLAELFPDFCGTKTEIKQSVNRFTTPARTRLQLAQPTCSVASPESLKTGQHYDLGVFDDMINDQNYRSVKLLRKAEEDFNMCYPLIDPGCPRFVTGTRYAFGDMYENIMRRDAERNDWNISLKTCWLDGINSDSGVRFPQQKTRDGRMVGFTKEMLLAIMRDSPGIFASQYLNQPMLESQQVITKEMLQRALIFPTVAPALSQATLFLDLAATDIETYSDDCVILAGKLDSKGCMYVADQRGGQWIPATFALNVIDMALRHRPQKILIEKSSAGIIFVEYLKIAAREKNIVLPIDFIKIDTKAEAKNTRVGALAGHINNGRFKFFMGLAQWEKACEQAIQFPKGRHGHDDYPDTWALMAQHFGQSILFMPTIPIQTTMHPVVAILDRDPVMQSLDSLGVESECRDGIGTMGGEFSC